MSATPNLSALHRSYLDANVIMDYQY